MDEISLHIMARTLCHILYQDWENDPAIYADMNLFAPYRYNANAVKGHRYGTCAEQLALQYAFHVLGMDVVKADTVIKNTRSQHVLEKVGFQYIKEENGFKYYQIVR